MHEEHVGLKEKLSILLPSLDEKQKRLLVGAEASAVGHGGIKLLADITGMSRNTVARGVREYQGGDTAPGRIRHEGGGRKRLIETYPEIWQIIEQIIEPDTRGDPESPLRWTCKSVRNIADFLANKGYRVSRQSVARILHEMEYSLQANRKTHEGETHPDRNRQFRYINRICKLFLSAGDPVISVDTKKKELVGEYKNQGREWHEKYGAIDVKGTTFPIRACPRRCLTASTTSVIIPDGSMWGSVRTQRNSPSRASVTGGSMSVAGVTRLRKGC